MRLYLSLVIAIASIVFVSCNSADNKADSTDRGIDTALPNTTARPAPVNVTDSTTRAGQSRGLDAAAAEPASGEIIAGIDKHLISNVSFRAAPNGGFESCTVTITNTLPDVSFQKVLVEVAIKKEDGSLVKKDYYTVINIDPGKSKVVIVPDNAQGAQVNAAIIKIKSTELTKGEYVLAGTGLTTTQQ